MLEQSQHRGLPRWSEALLAALGLVVVSPILAIAGAAILIETGRPILFSQTRVGLLGRPFRMRKLRSMCRNRPGHQITASNDPRITVVGRYLRKTKVDELPALWNVLIGEMSLVGPRPEAPPFVDQQDPRWQRILTAKPGVTDPVTLALRSEEKLLSGVTTDLAQFYSETLQPMKMAGQIRYLDSRSWWSDVTVLFQTVVAIFVPSYGANSRIVLAGRSVSQSNPPETGDPT